jgi:hypothetical protein
MTTTTTIKHTTTVINNNVQTHLVVRTPFTCALLSSSHHIVEYLLTNHLSDIDVNCWFDMEQPYPEEYADMFPSSIQN